MTRGAQADLWLAAEQGKRVIARLRGERTPDEERAHEAHAAVVAALEPEHVVSPEPDVAPLVEGDATFAALARCVERAWSCVVCTWQLGLVALDGPVELVELVEAWRESERAIACERNGGRALERRRAALHGTRVSTINLRWSLRELVGHVCDVREWERPRGLDRLPRLR